VVFKASNAKLSDMKFGKGFGDFFVGFLCCSFLQVSIFATEFSNPGSFSSYQSNLGGQQVVEVANKWVGSTPQEIAPGSIPLGSLIDREYVPSDNLGELGRHKGTDSYPSNFSIRDESFENREVSDLNFPKNTKPLTRWVGPKPESLAPGVIALGSLNNTKLLPPSQNAKMMSESSNYGTNYAVFSSVRPYYTNNVLRVHQDEEGSGVWENMLGGTITFQKFELGSYISMVPKLDFILLSTAYENMDFNVDETLGSFMGLAKGGISFELPQDITLNTNLEFNHVRNLSSWRKILDAWVPSIGISKIFGIGETNALITSASLRYSMTQRALHVSLPGAFDDDGDNLQTGIYLSYIQFFGTEGQFMLMPSLGILRTEYLKQDKDGFIHWTANIGLNASWQIKEWLSVDFGTMLTLNKSNEDLLDNPGAEYEAIDFGTTVMTNFSF